MSGAEPVPDAGSNTICMDFEDTRLALIQIIELSIVVDADGRPILDRLGKPCLSMSPEELEEMVDMFTVNVRARSRIYATVTHGDKYATRMALRDCRETARQKRDDIRGAANVLQRGAAAERTA